MSLLSSTVNWVNSLYLNNNVSVDKVECGQKNETTTLSNYDSEIFLLYYMHYYFKFYLTVYLMRKLNN